MPHDDIMHQKARYLIESGRIENLGNGIYNVIGEHGTYTIAQDHTGKLSCNCQGYLNKGRCSHAQAVALLTNKKRLRPKPR